MNRAYNFYILFGQLFHIVQTEATITENTVYGGSRDRRKPGLRRGTTRIIGRVQSKCPNL